MKTLLLICVLALATIPAAAQALPDPPTVQRHSRRAVLLDAAALEIATADTIQTSTWLHQRGRYERDPLARPITALPTPVYAVVSEGLAIGMVAWSRHLRHEGKRWWWVPEVAMLAGNAWGIAVSR